MTVPAVFSADALGCKLSVTLQADKPRFLLGEPVFLTFRVATACDKKLSVLDGGDYRNRLGRADSYQITAVSAGGERAAVVDGGPTFGGLVGPHELSKSKPFEKRLLLAHWADFTRPGVYTISAEKKLQVGEAMTADEGGKVSLQVKVTASVEVLPASAEKLGVVIDALGQQSRLPDDRASSEASQALTMIRDDRVVPHFVRMLEGTGVSQRLTGVWGLRPFGTDEALAALVKALGDQGLRLTAAQVLSENPHPKAWGALWALRSDADQNVRLTVLHRLARQKDPETEARLREFEKDPSSMIKGEAQRYLRERKQGK